MADVKDPAADSAAEKPAIITHRAILQDPASTSSANQESATDPTAETKPIVKSPAIKLKPLEPSTPTTRVVGKESDSETIEVKTAAGPKLADAPAPKTIAEIKAPEEKPEAKPDETPTPTEEAKPAESKAPEEKPISTTEPTETESDEADAGKTIDPAATEAEEAKQAKHDAEVQKLADSKQYYLPINAVEKRRTKRFVALGVLLSVVLVVFWVDVAMDAGLIHLSGIKPVTHFFSN